MSPCGFMRAVLLRKRISFHFTFSICKHSNVSELCKMSSWGMLVGRSDSRTKYSDGHKGFAGRGLSV